MTTKAKAKVLAKLASAAPLVLCAGANLTMEKVTASTYKTHRCNDCHTEVAMGQVDGFDPFCPNCGGTTAPVADIAPPPVQEEMMTSITCPHCQNANVLEDRVLAAMRGKMHCAACGEGLVYKAEAMSGDDDPSLETEPIDEEEYEDTEMASARAGEKKGKAEKADLDPDLVEDADAIAKGVSQGAQAVADALTEHQKDADYMEMDMADGVPEDGDVAVMTDEDGETAKLLACVNGIPVMTLEKANAGDHADMMMNKGFHRALQDEVASTGLAALKKFGFQPLRIKVPVKAMVERMVQAALVEEQKKVSAAVEGLAESWDQSFKLSASALTNGFYKNRSNPLAEVMVANLTGMGFRQARPVVMRVMAQAMPEFVKAAVDLAKEIMAKSPAARNELAETLSEMNPLMRADEEEDEEVTSRLHAGVRSVSADKLQQHPVKASFTGSTLASELRSLKFPTTR